MLMAVYCLSFIDRKLPFILVESIKGDLHLSDTQIGLLTGLVFAGVYSLAALPLARIADRGSRKSLIAGALLLWSLLTMAGGWAQNFWQLALSRMGVAAGEAACLPASHSLLADYFSPRFRARAIGLFTVGSPIGVLLGLALAGIINDLADWRMAMFVLGAPGIGLSLIIYYTVREPERSAEPKHGTGRGDAFNFSGMKAVARYPVIVQLMIAMILYGITSAATQAFVPAYIIRSFGMSTSEVGLTYGVVFGCAGIIGALIGGIYGDRLRSIHPWRSVALVAGAVAICPPVTILGLLSNSYPIFLICIFFTATAFTIVGAPTFAAIQSILPPYLHASGSAIIMVGSSGLGMTLGPVITGMMSDALQMLGPDKALRIALIAISLPNLWAALHFAVAALKLRAVDIRELH